MKLYCYETESMFVFCVENPNEEILHNLQSHPYWAKTDDSKFIKVYPMDTGWDDAWYLDLAYKKTISSNFARLGESWIKGKFDWKSVLSKLARMFLENQIEWYIIGSASEAVLGVNVNPHDLDIVVHTRDFYKVKALTLEYVIEPLCDNKGSWIYRYFGKLCVDGASVEIVADERLNMDNARKRYERVIWKGYEVYITPLHERYAVEIKRGRKDRIEVMEQHMKCRK